MTNKVEDQVTEEVKSSEEVLLEKINDNVNSIVDEKTATLSEKASKSDVDSAIEKSIAPLNEKIEDLTNKNADLEAQLSGPAMVSKGNENMIKFEKMDVDGLGNVSAQKFNIVTKRFSDNTDVAGGRVDANNPFYTLEQANWARRLGTIFPASGGVVKLPQVTSISWASEATQPTAARTPGGGLSSNNVVIETWVSENEYSLASLEDVPAMDGAITGLMTAQLGLAEAGDAKSILQGITGNQRITTGQGTALPTAATIVARTYSLLDTVDAQYRAGGRFLMSKQYYSRLGQASSTNSPLYFDPATGVITFAGYPVEIVDSFDDGNAANELVAAFGDWSRGIVLATAADMTIGRFDQTRPGSMTYFGRARFKHALWDGSAIGVMEVGA